VVASGSKRARQPRRVVGLAASAAAILLLALLSGCGGTKKASAAAPTEAVKQDWAEFFDGSTPVSRKVALLQHGQLFAAVIGAEARSPLAKQTKVSVSRVTLLSSRRAKVTYTITLGGQPALANQTGIAIFEGGAWRVSDQSFCALLSLEGAKPPACAHA
jgi:hypothetical protein